MEQELSQVKHSGLSRCKIFIIFLISNSSESPRNGTNRIQEMELLGAPNSEDSHTFVCRGDRPLLIRSFQLNQLEEGARLGGQGKADPVWGSALLCVLMGGFGKLLNLPKP